MNNQNSRQSNENGETYFPPREVRRGCEGGEGEEVGRGGGGGADEMVAAGAGTLERRKTEAGSVCFGERGTV